MSEPPKQLDCGCGWFPGDGLYRYCDQHNPCFPTTMRNQSPAPVVAEIRRAPLDPAQLIGDVLEEYREELDKAACDSCEECGELVMCRFHSVLSALQRGAWTNPEIERSNFKAEVARLTAERDEALAKARAEFGLRVRDAAHHVDQQIALEALRTRLRGLEQQWRERTAEVCVDWSPPFAHSNDGYCVKCQFSHGAHVRKACTDELARLLTTPEEP